MPVSHMSYLPWQGTRTKHCDGDVELAYIYGRHDCSKTCNGLGAAFEASKTLEGEGTTWLRIGRSIRLTWSRNMVESIVERTRSKEVGDEGSFEAKNLRTGCLVM